MSSPNVYEAVLDRLRRVFGDQDTSALLHSLSPEDRTRLLDGIGRSLENARSEGIASVGETVAALTASKEDLEARVTRMVSHGRALEESLAQREGEVAQLQHELEAADRHQSSARPKPIKLEVAKFGGAESEKLLRWLLQVSTAAEAQRISDEPTRVAFAMSHLKGRAEDWAFSKRLTDPDCFPTFDIFEDELKKMFLPPNSDFRYRAKFLGCTQGQRTLQDYIHELRFLAANVNDESSLPETLRVTVFIGGLKQGPARTQLFREYPTTFEEAVRIALAETFSSTLAQGGSDRAASSDMDVSMVQRTTEDRKCFNCGRVGHLSRACRAPRRNPSPQGSGGRPHHRPPHPHGRPNYGPRPLPSSRPAMAPAGAENGRSQ